MSRVALTYNPLVSDGALADPTGASCTTAGASLAAAWPERTLLRVVTGGAVTVTVDSNSGTHAVAGQPEGLGGSGDLAYSVNGTSWLGPFTSFNVLQTDGSMLLEFSGAATVTVFEIPRPLGN